MNLEGKKGGDRKKKSDKQKITIQKKKDVGQRIRDGGGGGRKEKAELPR